MYGKIFRSMWDGTLRGRADEQLVMIYLVVNSDPDGEVNVRPEKIADDTGMGVERVLAALRELEKEDPESRSPSEGGRRIVLLDEHRVWGWKIVNHAYYRAIRDEQERRRQQREATARWRAKRDITNITRITDDLGEQREPRLVHTEAEADAEANNLHTSPSVDGGMVSADELKPDPRAEWLEAFEMDFYPEYPRKVKPDEARKAWLQMKPWNQTTLDRIMAGVREWKEAWEEHSTEKDKIPYPASFLRGGQWKESPQ